MSRDPLATFADIAAPTSDDPYPDDTGSEFYPGSKRKRRAVVGKVDPWAELPHMDLTVRGEPRRFYGVGVLAQMLGRKPPAVRKWERLGYIPESRYRSPGRGQHGQRRLYTREQIEGLVALAKEEGLIGDSIRNVSATNFPARAAALFKELV